MRSEICLAFFGWPRFSPYVLARGIGNLDASSWRRPLALRSIPRLEPGRMNKNLVFLWFRAVPLRWCFPLERLRRLGVVFLSNKKKKEKKKGWESSSSVAVVQDKIAEDGAQNGPALGRRRLLLKATNYYWLSGPTLQLYRELWFLFRTFCFTNN